jgi:hypothetical protein
MTYKIYTTVKKLELKKKTISTRLEKDEDKEMVMIETIDLGWFVLFEGSQEFLFVGKEKPDDLEPGTQVRIFIVPKRKQEPT